MRKKSFKKLRIIIINFSQKYVITYCKYFIFALNGQNIYKVRDEALSV